MKKTYEPQPDCLIIKSRDMEKKTEGGIYVPDSAKDKTVLDQTAVVVCVGERVTLYKADDLVFLRANSVTQIPHEKNLFVINEKQVLCKVHEHHIEA